MQSFLTLDLAHLQQAERLATADQPRPTPTGNAVRARVWPRSNRSAGIGLAAAATLILQAVFADCGVPLR
jgi:hypothetical protein